MKATSLVLVCFIASFFLFSCSNNVTIVYNYNSCKGCVIELSNYLKNNKINYKVGVLKQNLLILEQQKNNYKLITKSKYVNFEILDTLHSNFTPYLIIKNNKKLQIIDYSKIFDDNGRLILSNLPTK